MAILRRTTERLALGVPDARDRRARAVSFRVFMRMRSRSVRTPDRVEQGGNRRERHGGLPDDR